MCKDCGCQTANQKMREKALENLEMSALSFRPPKRTLTLEQKVLEKNDELAAENRKWFERNRVRAINMMSSPGAGKTLLLEKTVELLRGQKEISILTGDQEKDFDAQRLLARGAHVRQLNTRSSCHLDAAMIHGQLHDFVRPDSLLIIENVGNLVCPAAFDLGEKERVALLSTTEGEDKPAKYPLLFHTANLILLTKSDLIPHLDWSEALCESHVRKVNPTAPILKLSSKTGEGMGAWLQYLLNNPMPNKA
jgi:hydrogenase nickel incorporation protein HypB